MFGRADRRLEEMAERRYGHLVLCAPDFAFVPGGTRQDEPFQRRQHERYLRELGRRGLPFHSRSRCVQPAFRLARTFMNPQRPWPENDGGPGEEGTTAEGAKSRILVVEDDVETRGLLRAALEERGYAVDAVGLAAAADKAVRAGGADAVVLDVWLPDGDGTQLCRAWRRAGLGLPILMLTARTDVAARVDGLDAGADDYLGKPFAMAELRARLGALLRRGTRPLRQHVLHQGKAVVDFARRQAWLDGREVPVTRRELAVLERLAEQPGQAVAREDLLESIWGEATAEAAASLEVMVARLRRKLDPAGAGRLIRTVRGFGYALASGDEEPR